MRRGLSLPRRNPPKNREFLNNRINLSKQVCYTQHLGAVDTSGRHGTLQQGVRGLIFRTSSPDVIPQEPADELARLREQLHRQRRSNLEMKQMLQN